MSIKNLTPHAVRIFSLDGTAEIITVPPSGSIARVSVTRVPSRSGPVTILDGREIPVMVTTYGDVTGLPNEELTQWLIVSAMVRAALPERRDLLSPGELIRDESGQPIGCRGLDGI